MIDLDLTEELDAERAALERAGASAHPVGVHAVGYLHMVSPVHGEPVTFVPGEALPAWTVAEVAWRAAQQASGSVYLLPEGVRWSLAEATAG